MLVHSAWWYRQALAPRPQTKASRNAWVTAVAQTRHPYLASGTPKHINATPAAHSMPTHTNICPFC